MSAYLWRITGEASDDGGGAEITRYAFTSSAAIPPDPSLVLKWLAEDGFDRERVWYLIREIVYVGSLSKLLSPFYVDEFVKFLARVEADA